MKLGWSKNDEPGHPRSRDIPRNCGQLLGNLDDLLPCLYIAHYGASARELRERETPNAPGLFAVGERTGGDHPGVAPRVGLILPLRLCSDEKARGVLGVVPALIDNQLTTMSDRRRSAQAKLNEAFGGDLTIADKECLDGFFALIPGAGLFQQLRESFDYVTAVLDNPAGSIHIQSTARFAWGSYGELMEWFYSLRGTDRFGSWSPLIPFFVSGNTGALLQYSTDRWARAGLHRPVEEPSKWFVIRPGLPDAPIGIRLEMREHGCARLHLTVGDTTATIHLSEVFDPFEDLVAWGRELEEGDLPIQMEIDEEGEESVLTALRTENPERALLRVIRKFSDEILLEAIVARSVLAATLKAELRRFFATEFDPHHWDLRGEDSDDDDKVQVKERMLNHAWLATGRTLPQ